MAEEVTSLVIKVDTRGADSATRDLNSLERQGKQTERTASGLSRGMKMLGAAAAAAITFQSIRAVAQLADQYTLLQSRVRAATEATGDYNTVSRRLFGLSQETGTALRENIELFDRIRVGAEDLGRTNGEVLQLVEAINKLGQIGGSSATELQNSAIQLSQGLAGGIIRAEEFNSIIENTPKIAQAIATGLNSSVGELREMVLNGELLADDVFDAILSQTNRIDRDFDKLASTIERATTSFGNSFERFIGRLNESTGATEEIARIIERIASGLDVATEKMFGAADPIERLSDKIADLASERLSLVFLLRQEQEVGSIAAQATERRIKEIDEEVASLEEKRKKLLEVQNQQRATALEERNQPKPVSAELQQEVDELRASLDKRFAIQLEYRERLAEIDELFAQEAISRAERTELEKLAAEEKAREQARLALSEATIKPENDPLIQRVEAHKRGQELITQITKEEASERIRVEQNAQSTITSFHHSTWQEAANFLNVFAQENKAAALASIAITKGIAIAQTIAHTQTASMLAYASQLIPGDPTSIARASAAAAAVESLGAIKVGLIAATGIAQAYQATQGAGSVGTGGFSSSGTHPPTNSNNLAPITRDEPEQKQGVQIIFNGPVNGIDADHLAKTLKDHLDNTDFVLVESNSRNGRLLKNG